MKPKYFVIENVPTLLTTENGYFKNEIVELFSALGYAVNCGVLCAADYGVPQDRHRTCIIGKLDADETVALPAPYGRSATIWDAISDLAYLESGEGEEVSKYRNKPQSAYQRMMRDGSTELYNHIATAHSKITLERLRMIPPEHGKEMLPTEHLTKSIYSGTWCPDEEGWHREDDHYAVRHAVIGRVHAPVPEPSDNHSGGCSHPILSGHVSFLWGQVVTDEASRQRCPTPAW